MPSQQLVERDRQTESVGLIDPAQSRCQEHCLKVGHKSLGRALLVRVHAVRVPGVGWWLEMLRGHGAVRIASTSGSLRITEARDVAEVAALASHSSSSTGYS